MALKIIIAGAPGSGKGTQCEMIVAKYKVIHISTGDMLRAAVTAGTDLGKKAKKYMDDGLLVPDEIIIGLVKERLQQEDIKQHGWLLDGFPRTEEQAKVQDAGIIPHKFFLLKVPDVIISERITGRRSDPDTGKIYHLKYNPPPQEIAGRLIHRSDDKEEKVTPRLTNYHSHVNAIISYYKNILVEIDGTSSPGEVFKQIQSHLSG